MLFTEIIKDNKIFMRCFRKGKFVSCEYVSIYYLSNGSCFNRFGISVGKKNGNAVARNRIKRIFRAAYRECELDFPIGYDIIFSARNNAGEKTSDDVKKFIKKRLLTDFSKNMYSKPKSKKNR